MKKVMIGFSALFGVLALLMFNIGKGEKTDEGMVQASEQEPLNERATSQTSEQSNPLQQGAQEGEKASNQKNTAEGKDMRVEGGAYNWILKRQEALMERQRKLEEYKKSPEYQAMEKWKEEYRAWRENIIKQMQEAYNAGDFQRLNELKMKLIRNEGAPPKPQRTEQKKL
jgi:hypothetical protein